MSERDVLADCMRLSTGDVRVFRNSVGEAWQGPWRRLADGSVLITRPVRVKYGLCVGSSDLIGWVRHTVTPQDVGSVFGLFTSLEIKSKDGRPTKEQTAFIDAVQGAGGVAGVARSVDEARAILGVNK